MPQGLDVPKSKSFPELVTQRLRLRQFEARDADGLHACFGDMDAMRYWNFAPCKTKIETERWVRILAKTSSPYEYLAWAVAEKHSDRCIGMINYHHREAHNRRLELGYILERSHYGRGLMTEAVEAVIGYCFADLHVHRVEALIHPDNAASIRLVERLRFRFEGGPLQDYWRVGDRYLSASVYALINSSEAHDGTGEAADTPATGRSRRTAATQRTRSST